MASKRVEVEVAGRTLSLSNLDKVLYPEAGVTKAQVIDYYTRIAPAVLPHLAGRPLTLKRYPDGVQGEFFYEKQIPRHAPEWVARAPITTTRRGRVISFTLVEELATLVWLANLADLELHTSLSLAADIGTPTVVAFDLDPGAPATAIECCDVALLMRDALAGVGLAAFPKTSGSKGLQVYLPLNTPADYARASGFAKGLAELLEREHPDLVVSNMRKELRTGKVLVDWSQNSESKTTVCAYSLRARSRPTVSTPLRWDEVEAAADERDPDALAFEPADVLARFESEGDLFAPVLERRQDLPG
jgi:bifunctional non-homologous end joining protein LigD